MGINSEMFSADMQLVKDWGAKILSGEYDSETIFDHVNDLAPIFLRWAKTPNLIQLKQEAASYVIQAKDKHLFTDFICSEVCRAMDEIHSQVNHTSNLDAEAVQAFQTLIRMSESGSLSKYDILKSYHQEVVERMIDMIYTSFEYFLSPEFTKSIYDKVALLGMNYAEFNSPGDFTKANYLLQLLEKVGTIDATTRLQLLDSLTTQASNFSSALSQVLQASTESKGD